MCLVRGWLHGPGFGWERLSISDNGEGIVSLFYQSVASRACQTFQESLARAYQKNNFINIHKTRTLLPHQPPISYNTDVVEMLQCMYQIFPTGNFNFPRPLVLPVLGTQRESWTRSPGPMVLGFQSHRGSPKAGEFILKNHGKSMKNWMRTGGTTISGNFHLSWCMPSFHHFSIAVE